MFKVYETSVQVHTMTYMIDLITNMYITQLFLFFSSCVLGQNSLEREKAQDIGRYLFLDFSILNLFSIFCLCMFFVYVYTSLTMANHCYFGNLFSRNTLE